MSDHFRLKYSKYVDGLMEEMGASDLIMLEESARCRDVFI